MIEEKKDYCSLLYYYMKKNIRVNKKIASLHTIVRQICWVKYVSIFIWVFSLLFFVRVSVWRTSLTESWLERSTSLGKKGENSYICYLFCVGTAVVPTAIPQEGKGKGRFMIWQFSGNGARVVEWVLIRWFHYTIFCLYLCMYCISHLVKNE